MTKNIKPKEENSEKDYSFLVVLIIILAFVLRYYKANTADLWVDEAFSYFLSLASPSRILRILYHQDAHPPLFYFFLHFWVKLGKNPLFLRIPGILLGTFSIIGVYLLGKELINKKAGILAAFFTSISAAHIHMCRLVRMYSYLSFFIIFGFYFFVKLFDKDQKEIESKQGTGFGVVFKGQTPQNLLRNFRGIRPDEGLDNPGACPLGERRSPENEQHVGSALTALSQGRGHRAPTPFTTYLYWFLYTICMVISWYLHYSAFFVTIAQNIIVILFCRRINIKYWIYSQAAIIICYMSWFKYLFFQLFTSRGPQEVTFTWLTFLLHGLFFTSSFLVNWDKYGGYIMISIVVFTLIIAALSIKNNYKNRFFLAVAFVGFYTAFFILYLKSLLSGKSIFQERYFQYILPLYFLTVIGSFINKEKVKRTIAIVVIISFLAFNLTALYNLYYSKGFIVQRWTEATNYIKKYYDKGDGIIIQTEFQAFAFNYYFTDKHKEYYVKGKDVKKLKYILKNHKRVWLVMSFAWQEDPNNETAKWLFSNCTLIRAIRYKSFVQADSEIIVLLFKGKR